jgi:glycosyltransferase involved in cell wall biosynthesis
VSDFVLDSFAVENAPNIRIYPGTDVDFFAPRSGVRRGDSVGMVYRLDGDKVNEMAIEPFVALLRMRPQTEVTIVGGGPLRASYEERVAREGIADRFTFTRYMSYSSLPQLYANFAIFAAPVWRESFGQVTSFAMAMGIPVVGYAVGAIPEIVRDPTLLAPAGDAAALAAIMAGLLDSPERRQAIGEANRERARRYYSVDSMIREYESVYRQALHAVG